MLIADSEAMLACGACALAQGTRRSAIPTDSVAAARSNVGPRCSAAVGGGVAANTSGVHQARRHRAGYMLAPIIGDGRGRGTGGTPHPWNSAADTPAVRRSGPFDAGPPARCTEVLAFSMAPSNSKRRGFKIGRYGEKQSMQLGIIEWTLRRLFSV